MGSEETNTQADVKPFSIRQYVLASRHRSILHSWPFSEKHLQMCLQSGLRDVLPPFESLKGCSNVMIYSQDDDNKDVDFCKNEVLNLIHEHPQNIKNECDHLFSDGERFKVPSSHEEGNLNDHHNCNSVSVSLSQPEDTFTLPSSIHVHKSSPTPTLTSSKAVKDKRRSRRRGRCKKRSMAEILAVARHCTLEEIYRMNKFCYSSSTETTGIERCQQMVPFVENVTEDVVKGDEDSYRQAASEDHEVGNTDDMTGERTFNLKIKINGCISNWGT